MKNLWIWLTLFAIAMAYLEAAVVVYLREIIFNGEFGFPLKSIQKSLVSTELWREAATIVMLVGAGILAGKNNLQRFAFFIYSFAVWDIFYYVFLKVLLNWPESLFTWDLLFLIPVPWVGPVVAPCLVALNMIALAVLIVHFQQKKIEVSIQRNEWLMLISGWLIIVLSFIWDYINYSHTGTSVSEFSISDLEKTLFFGAENYVPQQFNWLIYISGFILNVFAVSKFAYRHHAKRKSYKLSEIFLTEIQ